MPFPPPSPPESQNESQTADQLRTWGGVTQLLLGAQGALLLGWRC